MVKIHYFFDPMCGWCYGATPLAKVLDSAAHIDLVMHPGGMIKKRKMDSNFRNMVKTHDKKIAAITGQEFSQAYHDRLNSDDVIVLDSYITAQAVGVMEQYYHKGFMMLAAIQQAHYQQALDVSNPNTLAEIAVKLGAKDSTWFDLMNTSSSQVLADIQQSQLLMNRWSVSGFPSFIIEKNGQLHGLLHSNYYGNTRGWQVFIDSL